MMPTFALEGMVNRLLRPPLHAIGDAVNAGLQLMLGHQVEVSAFVGHRVFAAEISHGIEFVISLGFADLHGFQRCPVYADTHLHAGRGNRQHAFDAARQCAGAAVLGRVHGAADQPRVDLGAIADVRVHAREPVEFARDGGGQSHPQSERAGDGPAHAAHQYRLHLDALVPRRGVERGDDRACGNRHGEHVVLRGAGLPGRVVSRVVRIRSVMYRAVMPQPVIPPAERARSAPAWCVVVCDAHGFRHPLSR